MDGRRQGADTAPDEKGSSQVDVRQKQGRPAETPKVSCGVCNRELDELEAMKSEAQDEVTFFCDLECFGKGEHARSSR
ncbi:MAG: hypothetical protein H0W33_09185 [Gammaproteobacteria bacterium]|nr:hypothetical protein [Gammaproteobacteria bacterium]